jgi:hypothetical protein
MIKTIMLLLPILMLGLVPMVNAHSYYYNWGFKIGKEDGASDAPAHDEDHYCNGTPVAGIQLSGKACDAINAPSSIPISVLDIVQRGRV